MSNIGIHLSAQKFCQISSCEVVILLKKLLSKNAWEVLYPMFVIFFYSKLSEQPASKGDINLTPDPPFT